jgi:hypothetical protein
MSKISTTTQNIRTLRSDELDAVTGGVTYGGCIRHPILKIILPQEPGQYVDQFASRLPSWVRPL